MENIDPSTWKKCNMCKRPIAYGANYWVCNVSTCNRKRTGLSFCGVSCWDAHLPEVRHREAWAEERKAPTREEWAKVLSGETPARKSPAPPKEAPLADPAEPVRAPSTPKVILRRQGS